MSDYTYSCSTTSHCDSTEQFSETKPVVRRVDNNEPIIFDLRERHNDSESHGIRVFTSTLTLEMTMMSHGKVWKGREDLFEESFEEVENERPKVRRLGEEERDDVAIIIDSGADVA